MLAVPFLRDMPVQFVQPGKSLCVEELVVPWHVTADHGVNAKAVSFLRGIAPMRRGASSQAARKLYIDRRRSPARKLVNEDDVASALAQRGFEAVVLEHLSFAAQAALFAEAKTLVAPHGAGLTNMLFSPPGATVIELMPMRTLNWCYRNLAMACGHAYDCVVGQSFSCAGSDRGAEPWAVSKTHLLATLERYAT